MAVHHSEVITIIKPDVFIFCHSHRQIPYSKCASVAQYHPLVGLCLVVGTLTSKQLNSQSFIVTPHMDRGNLFTLIWNIKAILHQKEFMFEVADTKLWQRFIQFPSLHQYSMNSTDTAGPNNLCWNLFFSLSHSLSNYAANFRVWLFCCTLKVNINQ